MKELISLFESYTGEKNPQCIRLKGEGSNRKYFRLQSPSYSLIGVKGEDRMENETFIALARHFEKKGLPTPKVFGVSDDRMYYIQEDLGDVSLFQYIQGGISSGHMNGQEKEMLIKTISLLPKIQFEGADGLDFSICYPQAEFDRKTIFWDLNYFKYSFLKATGIAFSELELEKDFERMSEMLLQTNTPTFLYRDFQSRNVMIYNNEPYFIDFQGGRKGPVFYDVASFLWQSKARFPEELREELLQVYLQSVRKYINIEEAFFKNQLHQFVLFRMLQVLGAYGFRGLFERKPYFLESIPYAIQNLSVLLQKGYPEYPYLSGILRQLTELPVFRKKEEVISSPVSPLKISVYSFSYKKGIPADESGNGGGYVFDCRAIHNPGKYPEYKALTGLDEPVIRFLEQDGEIFSFLENVYKLADSHIKRYMERGFTSLMFSFGCTGGQHRSVYSAQHAAEYIARKFGVRVHLVHREQNISQVFNG
ncbi:MAG: phosphotransferase [Prevotellaceae bacterium]|jgi:aminoglycoside/choline kinase family phosphotransferase|nr:phosphotransferase [Prevotellaceae bacterium]